MDKLIGYQYSVTGEHGYYYYQNQKLICKVVTSLITPVFISGFDKVLTSNFDLFSTIVPELSRKVIDDATKEEVASIVYKDRGLYLIDGKIKVLCDENGYRFYMGEEQIAEIKAVLDKNIWVPKENWCDFTPYFELNFLKDTDELSTLLIAGFPALRFGIS